MTTSAMRAVAPVQDERVLQQSRKLFRRSIVFVISLSLAGEGDMHEMMKVVTPLGVEPIAALMRRAKQADIVQIAFGHDVNLASTFPRSRVCRVLNVLQNMPSPQIINGVHGIEA